MQATSSPAASADSVWSARAGSSTPARVISCCSAAARPTPEAEAAIAELRANGVEVTVAQADVADATQLGQVIARIEPPLRGVLHAAGVVDDAMLPQLNVARFCPVMAPKVRGTWNLHQLTANSPLDFFVMFSSGAALLGSPGQANYAAANTFMDALAHRRRARGAPALSINWGSWSGVGMAAAVDEQHRRRWTAMGLAMIEPEDGVRMLQDLLYANRTAQAAALPLVRGKLPDKLSPFYAELTAHRRPAGHSAAGAASPAVVDMLASLANARDGDRADLLSAFLAEQVVKVLALGASHQVDRASFADGHGHGFADGDGAAQSHSERLEGAGRCRRSVERPEHPQAERRAAGCGRLDGIGVGRDRQHGRLGRGFVVSRRNVPQENRRAMLLLAGFGIAWVLLEAVVGARLQGHYHLMQVVWCRYAVHLATLVLVAWVAAT